MILARKRLDRGFAAAVLICGAVTITFGLWVSFGFGGARPTAWIDDLGEAAAALVAVAACLGAARGHSGRFRAAWALIGASAFTWFCGAALWSYYELGAGKPLQFPSAADALYLGSVPLAVAALFLFRDELRMAFATLLDGAIIAGSLMAVSWVVVLKPVFHAGADSPLPTLIALAYPVSGVLILTMLLLLLGSRLGPPDRVRMSLLAAGLFATVVADSGFAYLTAINSHGAALTIDIGWVAGYLLIALAGLRAWLIPISRSRSEEQRMSRWRLLLPYLPVMGAVAAAVDDHAVTRSLDDFLFYDFMVLVALVAVRQFVMLAENLGLNAALREQTAALQKREEQLRSLVEHSSDAATLADREGVIQFQSGSVQRMFAYGPGELVGTRLVDLVFPGDRAAVIKCLDDALKASARPKSVNSRLRHKLGSWTDCEITITNLLYLPSVEALVINVRDISDRKLLEQKVLHQADHDALTNLANRSAFRRALEKAVDGSALLAAILLIDLDDFKGINLALGSDLGDQLLAAVGARLEQNAPPGALTARLRSDEFAILLPGMTMGEAERVAERILELFRAPFATPERDVILPVSIGVAAIVSGHETASELLRNADLSLQAAKAGGKAKYQRFEPEMRQSGRTDAA